MNITRWMIGGLLVGMLGLTGCRAKPEPHPIYLGVGSYQETMPVGKLATFPPDTVIPRMMTIEMMMDDPIPTRDIKRCNARKVAPILVIHPVLRSGEVVSLNEIISGRWDETLMKWSQSLSGFEELVLVLFAPDPNLEYQPWSVAKLGKSPDQYIMAYQRVTVGIRSANPPSVMMVWGIGAHQSPDEAWNEALLTYPGDEYVDWVAISATDRVTPLDGMFRRMVKVVESKIEKPIMLTQFFHQSSKEWDKEMLKALRGPLKGVDAVLVTNREGWGNKKGGWMAHPIFKAPFGALMDVE